MPTPNEVYSYVKEFIQSVGVDPTTCWNEDKKAYYIFKGSAKLEVFVSSHQNADGSVRNFLRIFSGVMKVPTEKKEHFYRRCLEISDTSLGIKLTAMAHPSPQNDWIYATFERDIVGIDYQETVTCISDVGLWADYLDDQMKNEFGGGSPSQP